MPKFRVIKKSMYNLIGQSTWRGYTHAYLIEKRRWFGVWKRLGGHTYLRQEHARAALEGLVGGLLTDDGSKILYITEKN